MKKINFILIISLNFLIISCSIDSKCDFDSYSPIIEVQGPDKISLGETINFQLFHQPESGCTNDKALEIFRNENIFFIRQPIKVLCSCNEEPEIKNSTYEFKPLTTGTYTFRFNGSEDAVIIWNVVVE